MAKEAEMAEFSSEFKKAFGDDKKIGEAYSAISKACKLGALDEEAYFSHNIGVARTVMKLGMGREAVLAALLHNVEEHGISYQEIEGAFGQEVHNLIDSKERFEKALEVTPNELESAAKKITVVLTTNPSVVVMQLADVLDKLRRLEHVPKEQRGGFVWQVREVFAPLAHKLNIYSISTEMNERIFKHEQPAIFFETEMAVNLAASKRADEMKKAQQMIEEAMKSAGIVGEVSGRIKTTYSTYAKMKRKNAEIAGIYDLLALRVVAGSAKDCYEILGMIHSMWKPIPGEFDDYIAKPKENGYRSLHTSVFLESGTPIEIQIRTKEMQTFAEFGIASHWAYKGEKKDSKHDRKIEWIKQVMEWQKGAAGKADVDIFGKEVFALTPKGQVIELPEGATVIDFAYAVHSDIGDRCIGAKIGGAIVSLNTRIKNGDLAEIITSQKQKPRVHWLSFAKSTKAQQKIRSKLSLGKLGGGRAAQNAVAGNAISTLDRRVRLAKCCMPLPGDLIVGVKTTKRKISLHRANCAELKKEGTSTIAVAWEKGTGAYETKMAVEAKDRLGLLKDVLAVFSDNGISVRTANAKASASNRVTCVFGVSLKNAEQFEKLGEIIEKVPGVIEVRRE